MGMRPFAEHLQCSFIDPEGFLILWRRGPLLQELGVVEDCLWGGYFEFKHLLIGFLSQLSMSKVLKKINIEGPDLKVCVKATHSLTGIFLFFRFCRPRALAGML
jgi:hypothetical protein